MLLLTPEHWLRKYWSEESRPSEVTVRRWLRDGRIPGARKVGGTWYVDEHAWLSDGDQLLERILAG